MKRIFLSFRGEDKQQISGLRLLAANPRFNIEFYDESVRTEIKSSNAEYIKKVIREKINRSSITVCLLSELTYTSEWVAWELEQSFKKQNKIICMGLPNAPERLILPSIPNHPTLKWYSWNLELLNKLIEED